MRLAFIVGEAAAHWRHAVEVRVEGDALVDVSLSMVFCNLANSDFNAANSRAVGEGADAVAGAAAATGEGGGGGAGGKREERGRSERESSFCSKYFLAFAYV